MLGQAFGARFAEMYGAQPSAAWCKEIERLGNDELHRGYQNMLDDGLKHPPTLAEWVALCKRAKPARPAHKEFPPALPEPESSRKERMARGAEHIRKWREILGR